MCDLCRPYVWPSKATTELGAMIVLKTGNAVLDGGLVVGLGRVPFYLAGLCLEVTSAILSQRVLVACYMETLLAQ